MRSRSWFVLGVIAILTAAVYAQVLHYGFVSYDDGLYVTGNRFVGQGLSRSGLVWAFSSTSLSGNWHPLTWISHMADVEFFGLKAGGHHLVSILLHAANAMLLFLVLRAATGAFWKSALVAVLFAVHPLHVESVAWIAERKDVLSTLFWMLTMGAYLRYVRKPRVGRYCVVVLALALGLMAKSMLVTLPLLLLVFDWWPLGRPLRTRPEQRRVLLEKIPLFVLCAAAGAGALFTQQQSKALGSLELVHLPARAANALVSLVTYVGQAFWPQRLAFFYPLPAGGTPAWKAAAAGAILVCASLAVLLKRRTFPWLTAGWLWYLVTLLPVIGLVQVGSQARADRYTYIPLTGIFLVASWGLAQVTPRRRLLVWIPTAAAVGILTALAAVQAGYWRDDRTLCEHALQATGDGNYVAHNTLGVALVMQGSHDEAIRHYRQALSSRGRYADVRLNLGIALALTGRHDEALMQLEEADRLQPEDAEIRSRLGDVCLRLGIDRARTGRVQEALGLFERSLELAPDVEAGHYNFAVALASLGRDAEAAGHYRRALALNPGNVGAATNLRKLLARGEGAGPPR